MAKPCSFCAIVARDLPAEHVEALDVPGFVAFFDRRPQLKTHVIIASKEHISSFGAGARHPDRIILAEQFTRAIWRTTELLGLTQYRVIVNNEIGRIGHMHAHVLSRQPARR